MSPTRIAVSSQALAAHEDYCRAGDGERLEVRNQDLSGTSFVDTLLAGAVFEDCDLTGANLTGADLTGAHFARCNLSRSMLSDSCLNNARLEASIFDDAQLVGAEMSSCSISGGSFARANMSRANLYQASLTDVALPRARASHARMKRATIVRCDFSDADLSEVDAGRAFFDTADLRRSLMRAMRLDSTRFQGCGFAGVMGLPQIAGRITILEADVSAANNRSMVRDQEFFRERWGNPWDPEGAWVTEAAD